MTVLERPAQAAARTETTRGVLALARVEARRLMLHPLVLVALVGYAVWPLWSDGRPEDAYPVLQEMDRETQYGPVLIGLAGLLAANLAMLRSRRHGTEAHFGVLVMPQWRRTVAHALSVLPLALVVAALVAGMFAWDATRPGAVGRASVFELATGPLVVLLLGVLGVLMGRLASSVFAAPMAVVVILAFMYVFVVSTGGLRWLLPVAFDENTAPRPSDLVGRPAGWHVLYLAGLTVLSGAVAAMLSGGRSAVVRGTALGALGVTLVGAVMQTAGPSAALVAAQRRAADDPAAMQQCLRWGRTTYCAFREFVPWIGEWRPVVDGVRSLAGAPAAARELTVRQRVDARAASSSGVVEPLTGPRGEVTAGTAWGGERKLELAASVARGLVVDDEGHQGVYCDARGVLIMWLAISGTPDGESLAATAQSRQVGGGGGGIPLPGDGEFSLRDREYAVVQTLLERPVAEVARRVKASWTELVRPGTSTDRAATLLGVTAPAETAADREWACA
jgi:hypothetical protein